MNEEFIQAMYALAQSKGYNDSQEQFVGLLGSDPDFYEAMYNVADTAGGFRDGQDRFSELMGLKKKDQQEPIPQVSPLEQASTESTSPQVQGQPAQSGDLASLDAQVGSPIIGGAPSAPQQGTSPAPQQMTPKGFEARLRPGGRGIEFVSTDEPNFLTGSFGNAVNSVPYLGDFIDDTFRSLAKGLARADGIAEAKTLIDQGSQFNMDDFGAYVESVREYDERVAQMGESEEMKDFQRIYGENPNAWGFVTALAQNPSIIPEVALSSMSAILNKESMEAGMAVMVGGTAGAAAATGGAGAPIGAAASVPFAFAAASAQVEITAVFTDLVKEELGDREWNEENVYHVLSNEEMYNNIRRKAKLRGYTIAAIDALTGKVGGSVAVKLGKAGKKTFGTVAATGIESFGGAGGEIAGSAIIGQETTGLDVGLEAVGGLGTAPIDIAAARAEDRARNRAIESTAKESVIQSLNKNPVGLDAASYKINGEEVDLETFNSIISGASAQELMDLDVEVFNDPKAAAAIGDRMADAQIDSQLPSNIQGEDRAKLISLERERAALEGNTTRAGKQRMAQVDARIQGIMGKYDVEPDVPIAPAPSQTVGDALSGATEVTATMADGTRGVIRRDSEYGDKIVFETEDKIIELGSSNDLLDDVLDSQGITIDQTKVAVGQDGEISFEGNVIDIQNDLPTKGIEYNEDGSIKSMAVKTSDGSIVVLKGQDAEDAAYQFALQGLESEEQAQQVNEQLDQDEEFQRDHDEYVNRKKQELAGETEGATTAPADEVPQQVPTEGRPRRPRIPAAPEPVNRPEPAPEPLEPRPINREELAQRQRDDDLFLPKNPNAPTIYGINLGSFKDFANSLRRKGFSSRGMRTRTARTNMEQREADLSYYNNLVDRTTRDFNALWKKETKGMTNEQKQQLNADVDAVLRGQEPSMTLGQPTLSPEMLAIVNDMRAQVDALSMALINSGTLTNSQLEVVSSNLGQYLRTSYRMFDDPNYTPSKQAEADAREYIEGLVEAEARAVSEKTGEDFESVLDRLASRELNQILADVQAMESFKQTGKVGSQNKGSLRGKKDIPPVIQRYMGMYEDPTLVYARTMAEVAPLVTNANFLNKMKEDGVKNGWLFEADDPNRDQRFNVQLGSPDSDTYNPVGGLYTTPEMAAVLQPAVEEHKGLYKNYLKAVGAAKWMKTIASPVTHSVNIFGNIGFAWSNGHMSAGEMGGAFKTLKANMSAMSDADLRAEFDEMVQLGIIAQSPSLGDVRGLFGHDSVESLLESRASESAVTKRQKARAAAKKGKEGMENIYQAEDDIWKVYGFKHEQKRYADAYFGKPVAELTAQERAEVNALAAENIKNTYPNYGRVPEAIKKLRELPMGNFVSFQAEAYRNQFNIFALAAKERSQGKEFIAQGKANGDEAMVAKGEKLMAIGNKRVAGALSYNLFRRTIVEGGTLIAGLGMTGAFGGLEGGDEEQVTANEQKRADIRLFLPEWSENSRILPLDVQPGSISYIDFSAADPFGNTDRIMNAFLNEEDLDKALVESLIQTVKPFADEEMVFATANRLYNNKKKSGAPLTNDGMTPNERYMAYAEEVYDLFKPGLFTSIETLAKSDNVARDLPLMATGNRPYTVNFGEQFGYKLYDISKQLSDAKRMDNQQKYDETLDQLGEFYFAAARLGVPTRDLRASMKNARISKAAQNQMRRNYKR